MTGTAAPKGGIVKEVGSYLLAAVLMIACYFVGNFIVGFLWDVTSSYGDWGGPFVAALQTWGEIYIYAAAVSAIPFLSGRHAGVPPIIMATVLVTIMAISLVVVGVPADASTEFILTHISAAVNILGWTIFGFICLKDGTPSF